MSDSAKTGDFVRVHYTGKLADGSIFDSSLDREPLEFTLGSQLVIPGFESAILGMQVGEKKSATISNADAYGPYREELCIDIDRAQVPPEMDPKVGETIALQTPDDNQLSALVIKVTEEALTVDANHPLAGKDLTFEIELMEIAEAQN